MFERIVRVTPSYDVGYHSPHPMYDGQTPMSKCEFLPRCYYDGSGLLADEWAEQLIAKGTDWLWSAMEQEYRQYLPEAPK